MRYGVFDDTSAKDSCNIGNHLTKTARRKQPITDDYEFLENYDFISHLGASGLLTQYEDSSWHKDTTDDIEIDLDFMDDPFFFDEINYFDNLNSELESELSEIENSAAVSARKSKKQERRRDNGKSFKRTMAILLYCLITLVLLLGVGTIFYKIVTAREESYAFNDQEVLATTIVPKEVKEKPGTIETKASMVPNEPKETVSPKNEFRDAVFIGNSLTVGLKQTCDIPGATFLACQSLDIRDAFDKAFVVDKEKKGKQTILEALGRRQYHKIYLLFGINELGWPYPNIFIDRYKEFIGKIQKIQPTATIYVQSILPVTERCSRTKQVFSRENVMEHNALLQQMCAELKISYVDVFGYLSDDHGYLPEEDSTDGIHLRKSAYEKWLYYLRKK